METTPMDQIEVVEIRLVPASVWAVALVKTGGVKSAKDFEWFDKEREEPRASKRTPSSVARFGRGCSVRRYYGPVLRHFEDYQGSRSRRLDHSNENAGGNQEGHLCDHVQRAVEALEEQLGFPAKRSEIEAAQDRVIQIVRELKETRR